MLKNAMKALPFTTHTKIAQISNRQEQSNKGLITWKISALG